MARIHPEGWRRIPDGGALARKRDTLATLERELPARYQVWHGVHWARAEGRHTLFGEIDFVVSAGGPRLLLIQQHAGILEETPHGLARAYSAAGHSLASALAHDAEQLRARLHAFLKGEALEVDTLLYCPDYRVRQPGSAGLDPARIVDATRRAELPAIIQRLLGADHPAPAQAHAERLQRFFADQLELVPDVSALAGQAHTLYARLAGGLAEWARRIEMEPFRLRVTGTAGSGKTQLALAVLGDARTAGRRALYLCYNRPLADHMALIAPPGSEVASYHQLCDRVLRAHGHTPDFSQPGAFARLEAAFAALTPDARWHFDEIVIDEGQDFRPEWRDAALRLLRPPGRAWWLEDPLQTLYERPPASRAGWVGLHSACNYRSPADIVATLNRALPLPQPVEAGSPLAGAALELLTWDEPAQLMEQTRRAITRAIGLGYRRDMIALITFRGREHSRFTGLERLGPYRLKAYSGRYDLLGNPLYSAGDLLIDSVYRFKGQAAPCVIFTEIDCATPDPRAVRKLFVGATRASMKLILVASAATAQWLAPALPPATPPSP